jgi:hypothetical protein
VTARFPLVSFIPVALVRSVCRFQLPPVNRACGSPAHGLPTPFTAGIRLPPPGRGSPGRDHGSIQAQQPAEVRRLVGQHGPAEAAPAFVPLADEQCEPKTCMLLDLAEAGRGVACRRPRKTAQ